MIVEGFERFNHWYKDNLNPDRGWPGDVLNLGYWLTASLIWCPATLNFNRERGINNLPVSEYLAILAAEVLAIWTVVSAGSFVATRVIDRLLPESFSQKRGLVEIIQPPIRRFLNAVYSRELY